MKFLLNSLLASFESLNAGKIEILAENRFRISRTIEFEGKFAYLVDTFIIKADGECEMINQVNDDPRLSDSDLYCDVMECLNRANQIDPAFLFEWIEGIA